MRTLIARLRRMGFLILVGICLIIYIGLGIIYVQQGVKQKDLEEQIAKISIIVFRPMASVEKLKAEYDEVNRSLAPLAVPVVLDIIVGIARESGINVDPASGKFHIPPPGNPETQKMGEGSYQVLALKKIQVQGDYNSVMAFISDLDSGKTMETMLLKGVNISQTELKVTDEEKARREEFRTVSLAVLALMSDNITDIPNPINYAGGTAVNFLGDDPDTEETVEGFPDIITTAADRGYTGTDILRDGYVLYKHDKISDNTTYETVSYTTMLTTRYYYICEADGTVRQFGGPDVATAAEYLDIETVAILDVDLYTKPLEGD